MNKKIRTVVSILSLLIPLSLSNFAGPKDSASILHFKAYDKDKFIYTIEYRIYPATYNQESVTAIHTIISGNQFSEDNICLLDSSGAIKFIYQSSNNALDKAYYEWEVTNDSDSARFVQYHSQSNKERISNSKFPKEGLSLQALIYKLQTMKISTYDKFIFKLLVPSDQFFEMYGKHKGKEKVKFEGKQVDCYKVEVGLNGIIGLFAPKIYFWLTESAPHLPVKYQAQGLTIYLDSYHLNKVSSL